MKVQDFIQDIIEEEVTAFLGREKSERITGIDKPKAYRNGYGKPRKFALMSVGVWLWFMVFDRVI